MAIHTSSGWLPKTAPRSSSRNTRLGTKIQPWGSGRGTRAAYYTPTKMQHQIIQQSRKYTTKSYWLHWSLNSKPACFISSIRIQHRKTSCRRAITCGCESSSRCALQGYSTTIIPSAPLVWNYTWKIPDLIRCVATHHESIRLHIRCLHEEQTIKCMSWPQYWVTKVHTNSEIIWRVFIVMVPQEVCAILIKR
jgi:hypothetical protein